MPLSTLFSTGALTPKNATLANAPLSPHVFNTGRIGVQAKSPIQPTKINTLPKNQATTTVQNSGNKFDQNVLNQQKQLNTQGAGLKEDGILGPLTQSAISKYSGNQQNSNQAPIYPQQNNQQSSAPQTGYQPNDNGLYGKMITDLANRSQTVSPEYKEAYQYNKDLQQQLRDLKEQEQKTTKDIYGTAGFMPQALGQEGLTNRYFAGKEAAISGQQAQASGLLGAAQSQAQLQQQGLTNAIGASAPQQYGLMNQPFNPVTGTYGGGGEGGAINRAQQAGRIGAAQTLGGSYQEGLSRLQAADGLKNQIISTLQNNPTLNNTPVSAFTNLNEFLSGQSSQPGQQLLSQQIAQYIQTLGLDPATATNIAHQQQGTMAQLLDSLRQTAQIQNEAKNQSGSYSGGSTGGGLYSF